MTADWIAFSFLDHLNDNHNQKFLILGVVLFLEQNTDHQIQELRQQDLTPDQLLLGRGLTQVHD